MSLEVAAIGDSIAKPIIQIKSSCIRYCHACTRRARVYLWRQPAISTRQWKICATDCQTMILNSIEYWAMNNPVRRLIQRRLEAPRLESLCKGRTDSILEIGCGQGAGARIIYNLFSPGKYVGIDLDSRMVERAKKKEHGLGNALFLQADATRLPFTDGTFDLAVDFGIIHHVPNWRAALAEIHRTLNAHGELYFEELPVETWERGIGKPLKRLLAHPYDEMFRQDEFVDELERLGFEVEMYEDSLASLHYFWGRARKTLPPQSQQIPTNQ